ncbi:MAG: glycosyltransferase family 2 protein, partial [Prevotella sp.]|nr:glycosyltransferase family 2 protein [Prevotella sp.]
MAKVSVLVAVYNAERWIRQSLDSLVSQSLGDIEVICVDDCSTDSSWDILQQYAAADSRISAYRLTQNSGQAVARNYGLQYATANYITFLDSDDWLSADAMQQSVDVFSAYPQTDCVLLRLVHVEGDRMRDYPMQPFQSITGREAFELSIDWSIHGCYVARRSLYEQFPYDDTCRSYSDDNTTRLHYYASREVRCCDGIYYYRYNAQSVTHHISVRRFDYLRANESMRRQLIGIGASEHVVRRYEQIRWLVLIDLCMFLHVHGSELSPADRHYGLAEIRRVWGNIDRKQLDRTTIAKFGYRRAVELFAVDVAPYAAY